ncbi:hypothetical protein ABIC60_003579 [Phyllobacterium ifriqiyense]
MSMIEPIPPILILVQMSTILFAYLMVLLEQSVDCRHVSYPLSFRMTTWFGEKEMEEFEYTTVALRPHSGRPTHRPTI